MDGSEDSNPDLGVDEITNDEDRHLYAHAYVVFSSRRTNPSGRGKVGWSAGAKVSNAFMSRSELINKTVTINNNVYNVSWSDDAKYKIPYRIWAGIEYDLRKDLKFLALAWIDNGYKTMDFGPTWQDYIGSDGTAMFSIDSPRGSPSLIDFDFGMQYAVSETFRFGIHFQQPYLDFYWEFFEFFNSIIMNIKTKLFLIILVFSFTYGQKETNSDEVRNIRLENFKNNYKGQTIRFTDQNSKIVEGVLMEITDTDFVISINNSAAFYSHENVDFVYLPPVSEDLYITASISILGGIAGYVD